jgi:hypothetical protein
MNILNKMSFPTIIVMALISRPPETALKMPRGFHVQVVADALGTARHLAVSKQGLVYVKLGKLKGGKGIIVLEGVNGDGKAGKRNRVRGLHWYRHVY